MPVNSRAKGANFEREIGNLLVQDLDLRNPVKRILEQTRTKELPDLMMGRWCIECKRYGDGSEPSDDWWNQVLTASSNDNQIPALVYKFNRKPLKVRILASSINAKIKNKDITVDLSWEDFIGIIKELFSEDIDLHEKSPQV
tara:strand:- start:1073 stop:1498 length:426 start_codon:yes stop_codon:yes gene_type:complete